MIYTVTLNPAVDKTALSPGFAAGRVNRLSRLRLDAGGKGVNVSKVLHSLGCASVALGFAGGRTGELLRRALSEAGVEADLVPAQGETRTNLKIADPQTGVCTDINEPGQNPGEEALRELETRLFSRARAGDAVVLAGGLPEGVPDGIYADWTRRLKAAGVWVAVDADGERLRLAAAERPDLVKPNDAELREMLGLPDQEIPTLARAARELCRAGVGMAAVTLGARGALFVRGGDVLLARGPEVRAVSTAGAGDTVTACLTYAHARGLSPEEAARLAVGAATAKVLREGGSPPSLREILDCAGKTTVSDGPAC